MSEQAERDEPQTLDELNRQIAAAKPGVQGGTEPVFGEGPVGAAVALVGEQPGDAEDRQGRPFVGPAGRLLRKAMAEAGIDEREAYITNAVKHFKHEPRGKRRLHRKPDAGEVRHYRWWLDKELHLVGPKLVVALGGTAVLALAGKALPIGRNRGPIRLGDFPGYITVHPSSLLRIPDSESRHREYSRFVADFKKIHELYEAA